MIVTSAGLAKGQRGGRQFRQIENCWPSRKLRQIFDHRGDGGISQPVKSMPPSTSTAGSPPVTSFDKCPLAAVGFMPATPASSPAGKAPPSNSTVKIATRLGSPNNAATGAILGSTRISICQLLSPLSFIRSDKNAIAPPTEYSETSQLPPDSPAPRNRPSISRGSFRSRPGF